MKKLLVAPVAAGVIALSGCGSHHHHHVVYVPSHTHVTHTHVTHVHHTVVHHSTKTKKPSLLKKIKTHFSKH